MTAKLVESFRTSAQYTRRMYQTKQAQHLFPLLTFVTACAGVVFYIVSFVFTCAQPWARRCIGLAAMFFVISSISVFDYGIIMACSSTGACNGPAVSATVRQGILVLSVFVLDVWSMLKMVWQSTSVSARVTLTTVIENLLANPGGATATPPPVPVSLVVDVLFWTVCASVLFLVLRPSACCRSSRK